MSTKHNIYGSLFVSNNITGDTLTLSTINQDNTLSKLLVWDDSSNKIVYRDLSTITGDTVVNNYVSGGTYNNSTFDINFSGNSLETTFDVGLGSLISSVSGDTFIVSGNANVATSQLTFTNNSGGTFNVNNSASLFSDNDINVTGGTYNPSNGCVTFSTNSGTTFDVCGFVTGMTDTFVTGGTLSGTDLILEKNNGVDVSGIDLSSLISGKLDITTFNTYTGDTQSILDSKTDNIDFTTHTGDTNNPHQTSFISLTSTAHTHTISDVINLQSELDGKLDVTTFNTYSGDVQTQLNSKIENGVNSGGTNEVFSGKSGTDLYFRTISGGTNTTISTINDVIRVDVTVPIDTNTYVTGGTYNTTTDIITLTRNDSVTIDITGVTDNFVVAGSYSDSTDTISLLREDGSFVNITGVTDTFTTGATYDNGTTTATFTKNDGTSYTLDLSTIDVNDTYITGGTYNLGTLTLDRNDGNSVLVTGLLTGNTLQEVLINGNTSGGNDIIMTEEDDVVFNYSSFANYINTRVLTGNRTILFPDKSGTVALLSDTTGHTENYYVTGFTYNDSNTFTISRNDGVNLTSTINTMTGLTINGTLVVDTLSATTINGSISGLTLNDLDDVTTNIPISPDNTYQGRQIYFDVTSNEWIGTEEYGSIGTVTIWGKKGSAGTIDKGCPIYITGFDDDIHEVELANATTGVTMPVIGFTAEDFDDTTTNPIITFGKITGLDTTSTISTLNPNGETWEVNDVLYMAKSDGGLTKFRPSGIHTQIQRIAKVLKVNSNSGQLFIFNTARTAGLPNLTTDYLWAGNGNDTPQEVFKTDVGVTTTGFTYNNDNTLTISDDNGGTFSATINQMSGLTINGTLSATTLDALNILSGGTNLTTIIESLDTYVTGGTVSVPATDSSNSGSIGLFYKNFDGTPRILPFEDTFVTGTTFSSNEATLTRNDGTDVLKITGDTNVVLSNPSTNQIKVGLDLGIKSGSVRGTEFTGNPKTYKVIFTTPYPDTDYSINITGSINRNFTFESKTAASFIINSNSNTAFSDNVDWTTIKYGEQ